MKKLFVVISAALLSMGAYAQDAQQVSADAAQAVNDAPASETKAPKPSNWTNSLKTNVTVGQTGLTNWAAGGDNTVSMAAFRFVMVYILRLFSFTVRKSGSCFLLPRTWRSG